VKIEENSMTQITRVLNVEVQKTEDQGKTVENTENSLDISCDPGAIFL
jgi:hypothetical protein